MAYTIVGNAVTDRAAVTEATDYTYIDLNVSAPGRGILKEAHVWAVTNASIKIKVFRDDGTNYIFIGESPTTAVAAGASRIVPCWIPVEKGDYIGIYIASGTLEQTVGAGSRTYKITDITDTSLKSGWTAIYGVYSLNGYVFSRVVPLMI